MTGYLALLALLALLCGFYGFPGGPDSLSVVFSAVVLPLLALLGALSLLAHGRQLFLRFARGLPPQVRPRRFARPPPHGDPRYITITQTVAIVSRTGHCRYDTPNPVPGEFGLPDYVEILLDEICEFKGRFLAKAGLTKVC
jgi:hypothetical protein